MSEFQTLLEETRNEATPTPEPTPEITGNEVTQPTTPDVDEDYPDTVREYLAQNPDHKSIADQLNRQFKAAFTPKLQEAAELRKQFEGVDQTFLNQIRQLQQLAQTDPATAAHYLRQQAELLAGQQEQQATANPYDEYVPATDVEGLLLNKVREIEAWKAQQEQQVQQLHLKQRAVQVHQEFADVEKQFGIQVPLEDRAKVWEVADKANLSIRDAYVALNHPRLLEQLTQKARDEASSIVAQKTQMINPAGVAQRGGTPGETPKGFANILRAELANLG